MIDLQEIITDLKLLHGRVLYRDGFAFTSLANIGNPANVFDAIIIRNPSKTDCFSPKLGKSSRLLQDHIDFINQYQLEKAVIIAEDIDFLTQCPSLKHLQIIPSDTASEFSFAPLYIMPNILSLNCSTEYGLHFSRKTELDYQHFQHLRDLDIAGGGHINVNKLSGIRRLNVSRNSGKDLSGIVTSPSLESLNLTQCGIKSMQGVKDFVNLSELSLCHNKCVEDVFEIVQCADSLKSLSIDACPRITDFSFLERLYNLEYLELIGNNSLPNLEFLPKMKKLKCFIFSMNVVNGDLSNCRLIPYVYSMRNRKHYNLLDKELPKQIKTGDGSVVSAEKPNN